jgi:hypothetical protein
MELVPVTLMDTLQGMPFFSQLSDSSHPWKSLVLKRHLLCKYGSLSSLPHDRNAIKKKTPEILLIKHTHTNKTAWELLLHI